MERSYSPRNEGCIVAVRGVPIPPVEYANGLSLFDWQIPKETYEAYLVIDLDIHEPLEMNRTGSTKPLALV